MGRGCGGKRGPASAAHRSPSSPDTPTCSAAPRARQSHIHAPRGARGRERYLQQEEEGIPRAPSRATAEERVGSIPGEAAPAGPQAGSAELGHWGGTSAPRSPAQAASLPPQPLVGGHTRGNDQYLGGWSHGENITGGARKTSPTPKDIHRATADEE